MLRKQAGETRAEAKVLIRVIGHQVDFGRFHFAGNRVYQELTRKLSPFVSPFVDLPSGAP
jgi:hypothetical protein